MSDLKARPSVSVNEDGQVYVDFTKLEDGTVVDSSAVRAQIREAWGVQVVSNVVTLLEKALSRKTWREDGWEVPAIDVAEALANLKDFFPMEEQGQQ